MTDEGHHSVTEVLGELDELAASQPEVSIGDVLDDFGSRSFGPLIMLPALIEMSPVGGLPGVPSLLAFIIALTALQLLIGKEHVWLPQLLQRRAVSARTLHRTVARLRGLGAFLDSHTEGRMEALVEGIGPRIAGLVVIVLACTVPPLEFLPFASSLPMLAIAVLGLALTVRDGALLLAALLFAALASSAGAWLFLGGAS